MKEFFTHIHLYLLRFRILQVSITGFLAWMLYKITLWITTPPFIELTEWQVAPIAAAMLALVHGFLEALKLSIRTRDLDPEEMSDPEKMQEHRKR